MNKINADDLLDALKTIPKYGCKNSSIIRLNSINCDNYVPYVHYDDVIDCIRGFIKNE